MILSNLDNIAYNKFANGEITLAEYLKYQNRNKIMNYEEKYKQALERMKSWARGEHPECFSEAQKAAEFIFPELAESEDERNIKDLIDELKCSLMAANCQNDACGGGHEKRITLLEWGIAWLEKQGKQTTDKIESNPAWSEYDEGMLTWLCRIIHSQRLDRAITLKEESELGEWMDKWLNYNLQTKQGEQKDSVVDFKAKDLYVSKVDGKIHNIYHSVDKAEPKFKVGDWIVTDDSYGKIVRHVDEIKSIDKKYIVSDENGIIYNISFSTEHKWHKWAIEDASAGDVLYLKHDGVEHIIIYKRLVKKNFHTILSVHCAYDGSTNDFFEDVDSYHCITSWRDEKEIHPATKEQRDLLFQKMKEAGYEWDSEKKELKKIETHYDIKNFHAGMPVLVRIYNNHKWCYLLFSHCYKHQGISHFQAGGAGWLQCIPFEGNEHLLGTTDMCDDKFINW